MLIKTLDQDDVTVYETFNKRCPLRISKNKIANYVVNKISKATGAQSEKGKISQN